MAVVARRMTPRRSWRSASSRRQPPASPPSAMSWFLSSPAARCLRCLRSLPPGGSPLRLPKAALATRDGVFAVLVPLGRALVHAGGDQRLSHCRLRKPSPEPGLLPAISAAAACLVLYVAVASVIAAMLIANVCYVGASYYLYRLVALDHGRAWSVRVIWLLAFFSTSLFLFQGYSEGLFLLCLVLCFYQLRLHHWWRAACWGALATATRPLGIIVIVPFLIYWYQVYGSALPVLSSLHRSLGSRRGCRVYATQGAGATALYAAR